MTILADRVPVEDIVHAREAHQPQPGRALLTVILGVFFLIGWLAGRTWLLAVDCRNSVRIGYWKGKGLTDGQIQERLQPAPQPVPAV